MTFDIPSDEIGFDTDGAIAFEAIDASSNFAASQDSPGLSIEGSGGWEVGEYIRARDSEYPDYAGPYTADACFSDRTFATNAKVMSGNAWQQVSSITPDNTIEKEQS